MYFEKIWKIPTFVNTGLYIIELECHLRNTEIFVRPYNFVQMSSIVEYVYVISTKAAHLKVNLNS